MNPRARLGLSIVVGMLSSPNLWAASYEFAVHDLGTFNGADSFGLALNDRGQIVGSAFVGLVETRVFLLDRGATIDLGVANMAAVDINDRGQILLYGSEGCFLRDGEALIDLGSPSGTPCYARDLNNRGQVAGSLSTQTGARAFLWEAGTMTDLGSLGGDYVVAHAINDRGQVVGQSATATIGEYHAFLWEEGTMTDLGSPGGASSIALAINNRGQVMISSGTHFYLWDDGSFTDLGTLGGGEAPPGGTPIEGTARPFDMNERGQILVELRDPFTASRYFVWDRGSTTWLPPLGNGPMQANDINDRGDIVGTGRAAPVGVAHVVLWTRGAAPRGHQ